LLTGFVCLLAELGCIVGHDDLFRRTCRAVYVAGALLDIVGQFVQPPGRFRIADLSGQPAALDNLVLYPDQQF
jgi:hypothetical protein